MYLEVKMSKKSVVTESMIHKAMCSVSILTDARVNKSQLAKVLNVSRSQPGRWLKDVVPRESTLKSLQILSNYFDIHIKIKEDMKSELRDLGCFI
jgi:hypothetical protein